MLYLTGQLFLFLLVTAFLGFVAGWILRGAMLPASMFEQKNRSKPIVLEPKAQPYPFAKQALQPSVSDVELEPAES